MDKIRMVEASYMKKDAPKINVGDTVKVFTKLVEADGKVRLHPFEGVIIGKSGNKEKETFTVRKVSFGEGIERVFPLHSPHIERIDVLRSGKVERAKLYYLREKVGKRATKIEGIDHKK